MTGGRLVGKFMVDYDAPHVFSADEVQLGRAIVAQIAFAIERHRAEETLQASEERLRFALEAGNVATRDRDLDTDRVAWSDNMEALLGLPRDAFADTSAAFLELVHPDDRAAVTRAIARAIDRREPYEAEFRVRTPGGTERWILAKGRLIAAGRRRPSRMLDLALDGTAQRAAAAALRARSAIG